MKKVVLGKGLDALIRATPPAERPDDVRILMIPARSIESNRYQPRKRFDRAALDDLKRSIAENGIIQPLLVRKEGGAYHLIAGERRLRAALELKNERVPVIVKEVKEDADLLELALIENIQREDLNYLERAESYRRLIKEFGLTQEEVAIKVGKERSSVANTLRILDLEAPIKEMMARGKINFGQARALLSIKDANDRLKTARLVISRGLSVRELEKMASMKKKPSSAKGAAGPRDPHLAELEARLQEIAKTRVRIIQRRSGRGRIEFEYYSLDELDRICTLINGYSRI